MIFLFTLGNSTDAFLLLRASQLGVPVALAPILWAALHVVKSRVEHAGRRAVGPHRPPADADHGVGALRRGVLRLRARQRRLAGVGAVRRLRRVLRAHGGHRSGRSSPISSPLERRGTAFGWYNLAIGLGALPASLLFGYVWDHAGPATAFLMGASLALAAAIGLVIATSGQQQRLPGRS